MRQAHVVLRCFLALFALAAANPPRPEGLGLRGGGAERTQERLGAREGAHIRTRATCVWVTKRSMATSVPEAYPIASCSACLV